MSKIYTADALKSMFPTAIRDVHYRLVMSGNEVAIATWDAGKLGPLDAAALMRKCDEIAKGETAQAIKVAASATVAAALGDLHTQASMVRWRGEINRKIALGVTLNDVETADSTLFAAIDTWEAQVIAVREAAIAAATPLDAITWPAPPAGVTDDWHKGF